MLMLMSMSMSMLMLMLMSMLKLKLKLMLMLMLMLLLFVCFGFGFGFGFRTNREEESSLFLRGELTSHATSSKSNLCRHNLSIENSKSTNYTQQWKCCGQGKMTCGQGCFKKIIVICCVIYDVYFISSYIDRHVDV